MFKLRIENSSVAAPDVVNERGGLKGLPGLETSATGSDVVSFVACGDTGPVRKLEPIASNGGAVHILGEMKSLLDTSDFVFANIEANYSKRGSPLDRVPVFRLDPAAFDLIVQAQVKIASLANNHMFDYGPDAFSDTLDLLSGHGIEYFGAGLTPDDALRACIIEVKNIKFGFIGFRDIESEKYCDNGVITPEIDKEQILNAVTQLREKVDWVIISLHFGLEYRYTPCPDDVRLCRELIEGGANIILGHHPHYPQGLERYKGGVIVYSLGNFIWDQNFAGHTSSSYVVKISVTKSTLHSVKVIPFHMASDYRLQISRDIDSIEEIRKLSSILADEKMLNVEWYFITRDHFQIFCKELWKRLFVDRQNPAIVYTWIKDLGPRYKKTLRDFFKCGFLGSAFKHEFCLLFYKLSNRKRDREFRR